MRNLLFAVAVMIFACSAVADTRDSAITEDGKPVVSSNGECVRTKWMANSDPCATASQPASSISLEQRTVYFAFNKSDLQADGRAKLDSLINIIKHSKDIRQATVVGYADRIGKEEYNIALSQRRAAAVEKYLATHINLPTSVLVVSGKGATGSVTNCATKMQRADSIECLAKDRRVEVKFNYAN